MPIERGPTPHGSSGPAFAPRHGTGSGRASWPRVLVVEDDESHVLALTVGLEREGLAVTALRDGRDAVAVAERLRPDVILLDLMLPGVSGIDICRELRARGNDTPIIFVSARSEELDIVVGIEVGADDYVPKPYRMRELVARIGALLRRRRAADVTPGGPGVTAGGPRRAEGEGVLQVRDVTLDAARHEVTVRGVPVELPLREFQLLRELLANAGRVVTRDALLERVWGIDYDGDPRIVATLVGRLRARVEEDPDEPARILTIRGVGYRYNDRP
ncbi:MAG TPA: response regulator transcription factor [Acidimicrobiales bacterium]|nr:response regulator transcription factor [Acidimicrobiales bacterium]